MNEFDPMTEMIRATLTGGIKAATYTTSTTDAASSLTMESMVHAMRWAFDQLGPPPRTEKVLESVLATQRSPKRVHKRRRGQSLTYHKRVQKKWIKRWGYVHVPAAYRINGAAIALPGQQADDLIVMHPQLVQRLRDQQQLVTVRHG